MIESMRWSLIGISSEPPLAGFGVLLALSAALVVWALFLLRRGYKLRN
jgi:hypothetical protein